VAKSVIKLAAILLVIILICYIALFGLNLSNLHESLEFPGILLVQDDAVRRVSITPNNFFVFEDGEYLDDGFGGRLSVNPATIQDLNLSDEGFLLNDEDEYVLWTDADEVEDERRITFQEGYFLLEGRRVRLDESDLLVYEDGSAVVIEDVGRVGVGTGNFLTDEDGHFVLDDSGRIIRNPNGIVLGLDLEGGSLIVFEADLPNPTDATQIQMDSAEAVIRARLDNMGFTEATVERQMRGAVDQIRVEVPGMENPHEAVELLGSVGLLTFVGGDGVEIMTGALVDSAEARFEIVGGQVGATREWHIAFTLSEEGRQAFSEATGRVSQLGADPETGLPRNYIAIVLDGDVISMPQVTQRLDQRDLVITGNFEQEEARNLAGVINAGRLDIPLRHVELRSVSALLGVQALNTSVIAGLIGLLLIILFMLIVYKLPGLMASIALLGFVGIVGILLANFGINLTLPGIAGILLSIGMANDANVLIFERLKEEIRLGKTVRASVDSGFRRALPAIIDGELTTLIIACLLLTPWATGPIRAFGQALAIGVVVSFFTAVVITRMLLNQMVGLGLKQEWLYGVKKDKPSKGGDA